MMRENLAAFFRVAVGGLLVVLIVLMLATSARDALAKKRQKEAMASVRNAGTALTTVLTEETPGPIAMSELASAGVPVGRLFGDDDRFVDGWGTAIRFDCMRVDKEQCVSMRITSAGSDRRFESLGEPPGLSPRGNAWQDITWQDGQFVSYPGKD